MGDAMFNVHFTCQRCLQPVKLDASFPNMNEHTIAELSLPVFSAPDFNFELNSSELDRVIPALKISDAGTGVNGFTLLGGNTSDLNNQTRIAASLLNIVSGHSAVDHPLCEECADSILDLMDQELRLTMEECFHYQQFLKKLEARRNDVELDILTRELDDLRKEEERLMTDLASLQEEEKAIEGDIAVGESEKERLDREEQRYWREYSRQRSELMLTDDLHRSLECQLSYAKSQLSKLKNTNVFKATFHIWHSGHFGTINNFRLGRLPSAPVDWSEINAAWGQTALLLTSLARKMNLTFEKFKLVPYGNHSFIQVLADHRELPLYGSGGFRFLWDTKFDAAMVAFLECLQQFKEQVEKGDSTFCLPYRMDKGKIEDSATGNSYSVKIQFNSEEQWTKALKFLLTNLKWGLAWVSSQFAKDKAWTSDEPLS